MKTCATCEWWQPGERRKEGFRVTPRSHASRGECRCGPPMLLVVAGDLATAWPVTLADDGCGAHEPHEPRVM